MYIFALTWSIPIIRFNARRSARREQRRQMKELKTLMYGLVASGGDPLQKRMDEIRNSRQLCFVMTDLEASTAQAAADPDAFLQVQDIHDTVRGQKSLC